MSPVILSEWGLAGAFSLGTLAALHPCPLSTLAGIVLLVLTPDSQKQGSAENDGLSRQGVVAFSAPLCGRPAWRASVLLLGMVVALSLVAAVISGGLMQAHLFSTSLPDLLRPFLPPLLIVAGILQTRVFSASRVTHSETLAANWMRVSLRSTPRMFGLGMVIGLSFCPATAGLFFGALIPLAVTHGQPVLYAIAYALGYGLPLWVVAACLETGSRIAALRRYAAAGSAVSGWGLIAIGAWLTW